MPNPPTPGEIAYAAWYALHSTGGRADGLVPWPQLQDRTHEVWDAVAQAVLVWQQEQRHG